MNTMAAMEDTMKLAQTMWFEHHHPTPASKELTFAHLVYMAERMRKNYMSDDKLNRWLGWMQATVCSWGVATMEDMAKINQAHRHDVKSDALERAARAMWQSLSYRTPSMTWESAPDSSKRRFYHFARAALEAIDDTSLSREDVTDSAIPNNPG